MAEAATKPFECTLPLVVRVVPDGKLPKNGLKEIARVLSEDLPSLNIHVEKASLKYVHISDVTHMDKKISVKFKLNNETELTAFKQAADEGTLSKSFSKFADKQHLHIAAGVPLENRLRLELEMKPAVFKRAEKALKAMPKDSTANRTTSTTQASQSSSKSMKGGEMSDTWDFTSEETYDEPFSSASKVESIEIPTNCAGSSGVDGVPTSGANNDKSSDVDVRPGSYNLPPPQPIRSQMGTGGSAQDIRKVPKHFYAYITSKKWLVLTLMIRSTCKELNGEEMQKVTGHDGLWSKTIMLKADLEAEYWYAADVKDKGLIYNSNKRTLTSINKFAITEANVQRDILTTISETDGYEAHIGHIMSLLTHDNLKDSVMQMECLIPRRYDPNGLSLSSSNTLFQNVMKGTYQHTDDSLLLLAVFISLVYWYHNPDDTFIAEYKAHQILEALRRSKPDCLPTSCTEHMPRVCEILHKVSHKHKACLMKYMLSIFPYLDESYFCRLSTGKIFPIFCENFHSTAELVEYLTSIYCSVRERFICHRSNDCKLLLETITRQLPLEVVTKAWAWWKETGQVETELQSCVLESMKTVVLAQLIDARKKKDYSKIINVWQLAEPSDLSVTTKHLVEDELLSMMRQMKATISRDSLSVVKSIVSVECSLFGTPERQLELLKIFAESDNKELHSLFLEMLKSHLACDKLVDSQIICTWYETALNSFCRDADQVHNQNVVVPALSYLSDICSIKTDNIQMKENLLEIAFSKRFSKISIRQFLKESKVVGKELTDRTIIGDLYTELLPRMMDHSSGTKPDDMIRSLCTAGVLRVNSRITGETVCTILDKYGYESSTEDNLSIFNSMLESRQFWDLILKVCGNLSHLVEENASFIKAKDCLNAILKSLRNHDVPCSYIQQLSTGKTEVKLLLSIIPDTNFAEIARLLSEAESRIMEEKEKMSNVLSVLENVRKGMKQENKLPRRYSDVINVLKKMQQRLQGGNFTPRYLKESLDFWGDFAVFPPLCEFLKGSVCSNVFWNVSLDTVLGEFEKRIAVMEIKSDDVLENIRELYGEPKLREENSEHPVEETIILLNVLIENGGKLYRDAWLSLQNDAMIKIVHAMKMISDATDIAQEVIMAENYIKSEIKKTVSDALHRLATICEIKETVCSMMSALNAFGIDPTEDKEFHEAVTSFENLLSTDASSSTFVDVSHNLEMVFKIVQELSPETIDILHSLGNSSTLINFLWEIVDEDIRNLIDAVEDISEQHVRESTVSSLIEVKRFLQPLLKAEAGLNAKSLFTKVSAQTTMLAKASSIPSKIEDCMANLHNLKSLYNNVANRGEQTREIIEHVLNKGKFQFTLEKGHVCDFKATYKQDKKTAVHLKMTLIDLRSRALLLMNTDTKETERRTKGEDLSKFVGFVDICMEIAELSQQLYFSGHTGYKSFSHKEDPANLHKLEKSLKDDLVSWNNDLLHVRYTHYLLNFIEGTQIHMLHCYLEMGEEQERVSTLLKFIHPDLKIDGLRDIYNHHKELSLNWSDQAMLNCIGEMLHVACEKLKAFNRPMYMQTSRIGRLTEVVQKGKLFVATLEENSLLVVKILLALYGNTTQKLPEPNQILFCTKETSWEEITLILQRCLGAQEYYKESVLFCITNAELLSNELQFRLVDCLRKLHSCKKFHLAVICRGSSKHPFLDELSDCTQVVRPITDAHMMKIFQLECPSVYTYSSEVAGMGKTNTIQVNAHMAGKAAVSLHISGPVHKEQLVERLRSLNVKENQILHVDIGNVESPLELDMFLFELILLRYVRAGTVSVNLPTMCVSLEIANTMNNLLRNSLQTAMAFQREHLVWQSYNNFIVSREINSPVQVVCHYLVCLQNGKLDELDIFFNGTCAVKALPQIICRELLQKYFNIGSEMSFSIVNIFLNVLADQLKKMSCSTFFRKSRISDMMGHKNKPTVRSSLVQALVEVSHEFSSRSINACRSTQESTTKRADETSLAPRTLAENSHEKTDGMIRWEESNHLIYVFHNQNIQTISPMYREIAKVPTHIQTLFESQMKRSMDDFKKMDQKQLQTMLQKVARTNPVPLPDKRLLELAKGYALTPDNLLKMVLIMMRIKANIPVIIMGETGCGKTSLVRYLADICEVPFEVLSIHAGVEEKTILEKVTEVNCAALNDTTSEYWLFLDEINTSEHLGLMSNIICHKKYFDNTLAPNIVVMAACNPYKLRTSSAISSAGLQGKVKADDLSRLVYRVLPLPEMMVDYVWDFGSLSENDEAAYISRMTEDVFPGEPKTHDLLKDLLCASQKFVRENEQMSSSVSLRDVQRCRILTEWFLDILPKKKLKCPGKSQGLTDVKHRAIILALAHCYHSRFPKTDVRSEYRKTMAKMFELHSVLIYNADKIQDVIKEEQKDILLRMELPEGTAQNMALQENVFVILVCILNRIPIFLVGKPGCSKSLSMQVIRSNLRGKDSKDEFFKTLPQLYCVSYQGSESSTSDGIIRVFDKAENYQKYNRADEVLSVVILDEIGLAEISRFNPLKVLHNLLEPDGLPRPNVAVVGISNWALDASKMNRAVHLSRPDMGVEELFETGVSISDSFIRSTTRDTFSLLLQKQNTFSTCQIKDDLHQIAKSYVNYTQHLRFRNFHGLRDYYSLVKFVSKVLASDPGAADSVELKSKIIQQGLQRNFGGLPSELATLLKLFQISQQRTNDEHIPVMKLIKDNVTDKMARHLMLITSGDGVMGILEKELNSIDRQNKVIIFGSQFEEDLTDDYNYRILSRIILCMEEGLVLVLKDLESIYGSLYDMLNQNYTIIGKKKNCRIALGHYSNPVCHVSDTFRCIVLVDECQLDHSDPPFLNRFEKQYLRFSDTITSTEQAIIEDLNCWINEISCISDREFTPDDTFPIYSEDMVASLVMKMSHCDGDIIPLRREIVRKCKEELMWIMKPEAIVRLTKAASTNMASDAEKIKDKYFDLPLHHGINGLIAYQMDQLAEENTLQKGCMTIVFTNSNIHSKDLNRATEMTIQIEKLGSFKSEKQLSTRLKHYWLESETEVLFLQCSAVDDEKHIMLAKSIIEHLRVDAMKSRPHVVKHVYIVVHLDRNKGKSKTVGQLNFLSDWKLVMLDCIEKPMMTLPELCSYKLLETIERKRPLTCYIQEQLTWAFTRIKYTAQGRDVDSICRVLENIDGCPEFLITLDEIIFGHITRHFSDDESEDWQVKVSCDIHALNTSSSFVDALEQHVLEVINVPLSKVVFKLECASAVDCFLLNDDSTTDRRAVWKVMLENKDMYSIDDIPDETGPECYACPCEDINLHMPFSRYIFNRIETTKEEFMEYVTYLKNKCEVGEDDDLPDGLLKELLLKQDSLILQEVPDMMDLVYTGWIDDYIHDFCNITTFSASSTLDETNRIAIVRWALEQKTTLTIADPTNLFVALHTTFWVNAAVFCADIQLLETCTEVLGTDFDLLKMLQETHVVGDKGVGETSSLKVIEGSDFEIEAEANTEAIEDMVMGSSVNDAIEQNNSECSEESGTIELADYERQDLHIQAASDVTNITQCSDTDAIECPDAAIGGTNERLNDTIVKPNVDAESSLSIVTKSSNETYIDGCSENDGSGDTEVNESMDGMPNVTESLQSLSRQEQMENEGTHSSDVHVSTDAQFKSNSVNMFNLTDIHSTGMTEPHSHDQNDKETEVLDPQVRLVELICQKSLPTTKTLAMISSVEIWQRHVNCILTLAGQVTLEPSNLHALRFCSDVAGTLVIPYKLHIQFGDLGDILNDEDSLDSQTVFDCIMHMVSSCPPEAQNECQRTLSQYFIRCLFSDPESKSYNYLLDTVLESQMPDNQLSLMKGPLYDALQNELETVENETVFDDILLAKANTAEIEYDTEDLGDRDDDDDEDDDAPELSSFLCDMDKCLKTLAERERADSSFSLLLVDLLEDIYSTTVEKGFRTKTDITKTNDRLLASHHILSRQSFGLKYVAAVAYVKRCVDVLVHLLDKDHCDEPNLSLLFQTLNAILDPDAHETNCVLQAFIVKSLGKETAASHIKRLFETVKHHVPFVVDIADCTDNQVKMCFDGSPLCVHIPMSVFNLEECPIHTEMQKQTEILEYLVKAAADDLSTFLAIHAVATTHYYLTRSHSPIDDTMKALATTIMTSAKEKKLEPQNLALLERLLGLADFSVPALNLSEESSSKETTTASFLVVLYSLLLGQKNDKSMFVKVLRNASEGKNWFLPGIPDDCATTTKECGNQDTGYGNCKCGHRLAAQESSTTSEQIKCIVCGRECTVNKLLDNKCEHDSKKVHERRGYETVENTDESFTVRNLTPVAYRILKIITSGALLGSMALAFCTAKDMEAVTRISETDGIDLCLLKEMEHHWHMLEAMLNIGHYSVGLFLHAVLLNTREFICEENGTSMNDPKSRLSWEINFTKHINELAGKRFDYIHDLVDKHKKLHKSDSSEMLEKVHEMDDIATLSMEVRNVQFPLLYRLQGKQTTASFKTELSIRNANEFPFLKLVLKMIPQLEILEHLFPILRWHLTTVTHASYIMKKHECLEMTVSEFLHHNEDERSKQVIKKHFTQFQKSWNKLENKLEDKSLHVKLTVKQINRSSKVAECLILDEESHVFLVLKELIGIQNKFLDDALALASSCKATSFLTRGENVAVLQCIPITEAKNQTIIKFQWSDDVLNDSQCNLNYNKGRHVQYDFESIERQLGATVLVNKAYLFLKNSLPMITFSDELYKNYVSMVKELNEVVPQKTLPQDVVTGIQRKRENSPKLITNLLTNLGVILSLVKKTKGDPDMPLVDYADQWKNMLTRQFPKDTLPSPETSVKLCHLVALHELLEEHNADIVIDSLERAFKTPLTEDMEGHLTNLVNAHVKVAENLLRAVKIFSHRCLSLRDADPALPLHEYLSEESFWSAGSRKGQDVCGVNMSMVQLLPDSLLVQHVHAMVSLIEKKIEEAHENEMKLDHVHTSWRNQRSEPKDKATDRRRGVKKRRRY